MSGSQSFGLSAELQIRGNYQTVLRQLGRTLTGLDRQVAGVETRLNSLVRAFHPLSTAAATAGRAATSEMSALRAAMAGVSSATQGATRSMGSQAAALNRTATAAERVTRNAQAAGQALHGLAEIRVSAGITGGGGGAAGAAAAVAGAPLWRRQLAGGMAGAGLGYLPAAAGAYTAARAGRAVLNAGGELQQEGAVGAAQVNDPAWLARLRERAMATASEVPGTTPAQNIRAGLELRTAVPDAEQALRLLSPLQGITAALKSLDPGSSRADRAAGDLGRALNLRGAAGSITDASQQDYARLQREAELLGRNMIAFRNMDPREWVGYFQQARVAGQQATESQLYGGFTASGIQAMGGQRFGTGQAAFVRQFANGIMTDKAARQLKRLGLIAPNARAARVTSAEIDAEVAAGKLRPEEAEELRAGHAQRFASRDMFRADLATSDHDAWRKAVMEQLRRAGVNVNSPRALDALAQQSGSTSTGRGYLSWLFDEAGRRADIQAVQNMPPDAIARLREGYNSGLASMTSGFETLLQRIGESSEVVRTMSDLGNAFRSMSDGVQRGGLDQVIRDIRGLGADLAPALGLLRDLMPASDMSMWGNSVRELGSLFRAFSTDLVGFRDKVAAIPAQAAAAREALSGFVDVLTGLPARMLDAARRLVAPGALAPAPGSPGAAPNPDAVPMPPSWGGPMPGRGGVIPQSFMPYPAQGGDVTIRVPVVLDGREITEVVTRRQGRGLNAPQSSSSFYDRRRGGLSGGVVTA